MLPVHHRECRSLPIDLYTFQILLHSETAITIQVGYAIENYH